ncbi:MAG: hypothetical protein IKG27_04355 [Bacilli bacterium]|nr:hypothetical protein [Bacilli bacterium]
MKIKINVFRNKMVNYFDKMKTYNGFNFIKKIFWEKPVRPEMFPVGNRYMVKYADITASTMEVYNTNGKYEYKSIIDLNANSEIDSLYTIVEYQGDGKFLDLTSGYVFIVSELISDNLITHTFTEEGNLQERLLKYPLGIGLESTSSLADLDIKINEVTAYINRVVSGYSTKMVEDIVLNLDEKRDLAKKAIEDKLKIKNDEVLNVQSLEEPEVLEIEPLEEDKILNDSALKEPEVLEIEPLEELEVLDEIEGNEDEYIQEEPHDLSTNELEQIRAEFTIADENPLEKKHSK